MNELEVLEGFRADAPEPDESWLRELRGRITTQEREGGPRPGEVRVEAIGDRGATRDEKAAAL